MSPSEQATRDARTAHPAGFRRRVGRPGHAAGPCHLVRSGPARRAIRGALLGEGVGWLLLGLTGLVLVTLLCDFGLYRLTHQPSPAAQRALVMAVCLAGVGYLGWRFLLRRLLAPLRADDLALLIERRYPQLPGPPRRRGAVLSAGVGAGAVEFPLPDPADGRRGQLHGRRAGLPVAAELAPAVAAAGGGPGRRGRGGGADGSGAGDNEPVVPAQRAVPQRPIPRQTYLVVLNGPEFRVPRGGDLTVVVAVGPESSVVPDRVVFHLVYGSVGAVEETVEAAPGTRTYVKRFQSVSEPFKFSVTGNDDRTELNFVRIVEPPDLKQVEFLVQYPYYMKLPSKRFDGMTGVLAVPPGSLVSVVATATKPLSAARMLLDAQDAGTLRLKPVRFADQPATEDGMAGQFVLVPTSRGQTTMTLRFELTDTAGFVNRGGSHFQIRVLYDEPPKLKVAWLGLTKEITTQAKIPLEIDARDDYGLTALSATVALKGQDGPAARVNLAELNPPQPHVSLPQAVVDLAAMKDLKLQLGQTVQVAVLAADSMPPAKRRS